MAIPKTLPITIAPIRQRARPPWLKWFPADWRADPRLRMCSLAARGLWIELLGFMHESEGCGHFVIGGRIPSETEVAVLVGAPLPVVRRALAELRTHGVFSVSDDGMIYSRRMVRDAEKAARDRANGVTGGNPALRPAGLPADGPSLNGEDKDWVNGWVNPQDKPPDKPADKEGDNAARAHAPATYMPEARKNSSEGSNKPSAGSPARDPQKDVFDRGKAVLGKNAGGLIVKLLKHCAGDCRHALDLLRLVESKSDPREYVGAILRGDANARTDEVLAETERLYGDLGVSR